MSSRKDAETACEIAPISMEVVFGSLLASTHASGSDSGLLLRSVSNIDVSVCIVNWNCLGLLRKCLLSILEQEQGATFEVIVVDNGSTDGAPEMVEAEFPGVTLIRNQENGGFSKANNQAARLAQGRYLFFLNNDTELAPHTLIELVELADAHPNVGVIGPRLRGLQGEIQISYRERPTIAALLHQISFLRWTRLFGKAYRDYRRSTFAENGTREVEVLMGAAVFMRRDLFERIDGWDEAYQFGVEDIDLSVRAGQHAPLVYHGDVEILHHGRMASRANIGFATPKVAAGYVHFFRKNGSSRLSVFCYRTAVTIDLPLKLAGKVVQTGTRVLRGRVRKARKSWLAVRELWKFLRHDLLQFWKA